MKKLFLILCLSLTFCQQAFALSTVHHLYLISRRLVEVVGGPFYGVFVQGPKNIKTAYQAEVWEQEKTYKNGTLKFKIVGILRAPGEEAKGAVDGITDTVTSAGKAAKEFISIFFGD
jgi:hypothetical protein